MHCPPGLDVAYFAMSLIRAKRRRKPMHWCELATLFSVFLFCELGFGFASMAYASTSLRPEKPAVEEPRNLQFSHITQREGLSQASINAVAQDERGYIWIGTQEGLNRYDGNEMEIFEHDPSDPGSLSNDWVWSVYVDRAGTLWAGTDGGGLNRYDPDQNTFVRYEHQEEDPQSLGSNRIRDILQDSKGRLWIGTDGNGLDRFDASTGQFTHFRHDEADPGSLPGNKVLALFEDDNKTLWVGTNSGLARLDETGTAFEIYQYDESDRHSLSNNDVRAIYEDRQGRFWVGTYRGGSIFWIVEPGNSGVFSTIPKIHTVWVTTGSGTSFRTMKAYYGWLPMSAWMSCAR